MGGCTNAVLAHAAAQELNDATAATKKGKAPGVDGIPPSCGPRWKEAEQPS